MPRPKKISLTAKERKAVIAALNSALAGEWGEGDFEETGADREDAESALEKIEAADG